MTFSAKLGRQKALSALGDRGKILYPIFVPAEKRVSFLICIFHSYPQKAGAYPIHGERDKYSAEEEKYVAQEFTNLEGFDLLDEANRYEISFPDGWKQLTQKWNLLR